MKKKKINYILLLSLIIIWGFIFNRIYEYYFNEEIETENIENVNFDLELFEKLENKNYVLSYESLFRDPFTSEIKINEEIKSINQKDTIIIKEKPLNYSIDGIIFSNNKKWVLLNDKDDNKTIYLKEKDKYKSLRIVAIKKTSVVIKEHNKNIEIEIN